MNCRVSLKSCEIKCEHGRKPLATDACDADDRSEGSDEESAAAAAAARGGQGTPSLEVALRTVN